MTNLFPENTQTRNIINSIEKLLKGKSFLYPVHHNLDPTVDVNMNKEFVNGSSLPMKIIRLSSIPYLHSTL